MILNEPIRMYMADRVIRTIAPIVIIAAIIVLPCTLVFAPGNYYRLAGPVVGLFLILCVWIITLRGKILIASRLFIICCIMPILISMIVSGGVYAPMFSGIFPVVGIVIFFQGTRQGIIFLILMLLIGVIFIRLHNLGIIPAAERPNGLFLIFVVYLPWGLMTVAFFSVPMRIVAEMLTSSEQQRRMIEQTVIEKQVLQKEIQTILDQTPDIIFRIDRNNTITFVSEAIRKYGYESKEVQGKNILDIIHPEDRAISSAGMLLKNSTSSEPEKNHQIRLLVKTALPENDYSPESAPASLLESPIFSLNSAPFFNQGVEKELAGSLIIARDITASIRMQERIVHAEKMMAVGGLAAGMAHEINNPLGIILQANQNIIRRLDPNLAKNREDASRFGLNIDMLAQYLSTRSIDRYLDAIKFAGERAARIVRSMLNFSRLNESEKSFCSINALLDNMIEIASGDDDFRNVEIIRNYADINGVWCMESEIGQVLLNIIKNAAQAMTLNKSSESHPRIVITTSQGRDMVRMEIEDNGPGIDDQEKKVIFQPFYTTKPPGQGTGLGLSISYFIITFHHNGKLVVESEKGKGAKFIIEIPRGAGDGSQS